MINNSNGKFMFGWAMPVDYTSLGARLESYMATRPAISTFKCCVKHASGSQAISKLSVELMNIIVGMARDDDLQPRLVQWRQSRDCMLMRCKPSSHPPPVLIEGIPLRYLEPSMGEDWESSHRDLVDEQERKVDDTFEWHPFHGAWKEFAREFGVEVHFSITRNYREMPSRTDVSGYLILPRQTFAIDGDYADYSLTIIVSEIIDPAVLTPLTSKEKQRFRIAAQTLGVMPSVSTIELLNHPECFTASSTTNGTEPEKDQEAADVSDSLSSPTPSDINGFVQQPTRTESSLEAPDSPTVPQLIETRMPVAKRLDAWPKLMLIGYSEEYVDD